MSKLSTKELFSQLQDKLIINLSDNEVVCPECKGLRFVLNEHNRKGYIESCRRCYTGKLYVCEYCEKLYRTQCDCTASHDERRNKFRMKQAQEELEAYQKADKISYKDYNGHYVFGNDERLKSQDDLEEWIYEKLKDGEDVPEYLWVVRGLPHFTIDLLDVINDKCEDGYEDMYDNLNTESPLLAQAQELLKQWENEQGERLYVFNETYAMAVIIKDLVEEIRKEIKK